MKVNRHVQSLRELSTNRTYVYGPEAEHVLLGEFVRRNLTVKVDKKAKC